MNILVLDIGGSHVKVMHSCSEERRKFDSGPEMTPGRLVDGVCAALDGWTFDRVSIGFPGPVKEGKPAVEPKNLGKGWIGFDFAQAFGVPCKIINDAAMQALGSYEGGRMLFLGLGTGLGSALISGSVIVSLELGDLRYSRGETLEDRLGKSGRKMLGQKKWEANVHEAVAFLRISFIADYVVLGGGNAKQLETLPDGARRGKNRNAFYGGLRLWGMNDAGEIPEQRANPLVII